jgi:hypothetical protein
MSSKHIFICSEFQGLESNLALARKYCKYVIDQGNNVFCAHLLFPQFLDEANPNDREKGIALGEEWMYRCEETWVFTKNGVLSKGMTQEIKHCREYCTTDIFFFDATDPDNIIELKHVSISRTQPWVDLPTQAQLLAPKPFAKKAHTKLDDVAEALKNGAKYEDLEDQINSFLGPVDKVEQDPEADKQWEMEYRRGRE